MGMNELEIQSFITQTEADLALARDFLAMWKRRNASQPMTANVIQPSVVADLPIPTRANVSDDSSNVDRVLAAIVHCPTDYALNDVEARMASIGHAMDRGSIAQALSRLGRSGRIRIKVRGIGRRPTLYTKSLQTQPQ
jgi:hypothetical protein